MVDSNNKIKLAIIKQKSVFIGAFFVTINNSMPSINNFLKGFQDGLPGMKDYQHASRLYVDDNFKLMPKQKFLFHVVFNTDETLFQTDFNATRDTN